MPPDAAKSFGVRHLWIVAAVNVAVIGGLVVLTVVVDRHLVSEIQHRQAHYSECAASVRRRLMARHPKRAGPGTAKFGQLLASETHETCGWSALAARRPSDVAGSAFGVVALGLFDLLLWRIRRDEAR